MLEEDFSRASRTGELSDRLIKLKQALETIPSSSTDSERVFSVAGRFVTKIRNRLSPKSLDNFTFGNSYFKKLDQNQINRTGFVYLPFQNIFVVLNLVLLTGLTDILRIFCYNNLPGTFSVFFFLTFLFSSNIGTDITTKVLGFN